uniref:Transmembrane and coiled-coil domains protein 1 n=1 Tax=Glossina palpalis gambiensis TaxID=67801 RepID=A0A1B0AZR6_9MUSC
MDGLHLGGQLSKDQLLPLHSLHHQSMRTGSALVLSRTSRSPSASRSTEQMSRERDQRIESGEALTTTSAAAGTASSAGLIGSGSATSSGTMTGSLGSTTAGTGGGAGVGVSAVTTFRGFRSQSPSNRRSRERNRTHNRAHGSDQGGLLAYGAMSNNGGLGGSSSGVIGVGGPLSDLLTNMDMGLSSAGMAEDSRLSGNEDLCYQSFASDELDTNPAGDNSKKHHRRHERLSSLQALDRLNTKIQCTKESIRKEQTARDDNVNEYLKLAASADKQQLQRIKAVFEKKNQKSAHTISQLQKKLDSYTKRVKDLQNQQYQNKSQHRQPREVLRDVGQGLRNVGGNIRDGITGFSGSVMSKPKEIAHLIKNRFSSMDNINQISESELSNLNVPATQDILGSSTPNNIIPSASTGSGGYGGGGGGGGGVGGGGGAGSGKFNSENGSECSSVTSGSMPADSRKSHSVNHIDINLLLTELEEQEQINDLTELHQNEIENLKQAIADMEEKVQYQSDERLQDVNEVLENCQTRISKMEHLSQQQYVTVEGIDNSNARALVVKLINVVLTILQVLLLLVATAAGIIMPFLKTRVRVLTTFLTIFMIFCVIRQWPDVQDIVAGLLRHLKQSLVVK